MNDFGPNSNLFLAFDQRESILSEVMRTRSPITMFLAAALCIPVLIASTSRGQCTRYSVKRPQPLGVCGILSESFRCWGISEQGDLVGEWSCAGGNERAFVAWNAEAVTLLNLPNSYLSRAEDMNSSGVIVGTRDVTNVGYKGFTYHNGQLTNLDWLPGHVWAETGAINESNVAVGFSSNGPPIACRWIDAQPEPIPLAIPEESSALAINDNNQIVGYWGYPANAFLFENAICTTLPVPLEATSSRAFGISDRGIACGSYSKPDPSGGPSFTIPVLWRSPSEIVELGLLPGFIRCVSRDLTDGNIVIGYCQNPPQLGNNLAGFIWRDGVIKQLDTLIVPNPNEYSINTVYGINNNGQIAVNLGDGKNAARLDPLPPRSGDTNCDWLVNVTDLLAVINAWGPAPPQVPFEGSPDLNTDGSVNVLDLLAIINDWG